MAQMNYKGAILASKAQEQDEDAYEDDTLDDKKKFSYVQFKSFEFCVEQSEWTHKLSEGEVINLLLLLINLFIIYY